MYLDEVGTDHLTNTEEDAHRYLSLTGVVMDIGHARDILQPMMDKLKAEIFDHDIDDPIILHRKDIVQKKKSFGSLRDQKKAEKFDKGIQNLFETCEYRVITAVIDKHALLSHIRWRERHPYHYLLSIIIEKYVQLLERIDERGDIMPEARQGSPDKALQSEFVNLCKLGTYFVPPEQFRKRLTTTENLKFRKKSQNIAGLQLCDLLAHPSYIYVRSRQHHNVKLGAFAQRVVQILIDEKYDRSSAGRIKGYGYKYFP